uniref:Ion transport domain-containing protein n=1 Tax=Romanomermis culicivorax TaxID=13658 RepID=A0A915JNW9_ROMCU
MARSIRNLYWAFYGYLPPESMDIVVGHSGPSKSETYHNIISIAGELLVGIYYICIIIVMLNLMVSMMTGTAAKIMIRKLCEITKVMAKQTLKLAEGKGIEEKDIDEVTNEFGGDKKSWAGPITPTKK